MTNPFEGTRSKTERRDREGEGRKRLKALEATGLFVFHGSSNPGLAQLEPRQAEDWSTGEKIDHGLAVCATPFADLAIFRSLVKEDWTSFGTTDDDGVYCAASEKAIQAAKAAKGYVYVMEKGDFDVFEGGNMEVRSHVAVQPVKVVEVAFDDLPPGIKKLDEKGKLTDKG